MLKAVKRWWTRTCIRRGSRIVVWMRPLIVSQDDGRIMVKTYAYCDDLEQWVDQLLFWNRHGESFTDLQPPHLACLYRDQMTWLIDDISPAEMMAITAMRVEMGV